MRKWARPTRRCSPPSSGARPSSLAALPAPLAPEVPESALVSRVPSSFRSAADPVARRARLDLVLGWPNAAMVP
ncbi:MAG TPA: hypothetical protein VEQ84_02530, partial [Vicinamibacteria bacterium]|nr:hypothetical protein [Vicinamibacteria bacterium]